MKYIISLHMQKNVTDWVREGAALESLRSIISLFNVFLKEFCNLSWYQRNEINVSVSSYQQIK